jgi:hypothetical protein
MASEEIKKLADLAFLAQNTGVSSAKINAAARAAGFNSWSQDHTKIYEALASAGYTPGDNVKFYGSNTPIDAGAKILSDRWQQAPKSDGDTAPVNDNVANAAYLQQQLAKQGISAGSTSATLPSNMPEWQEKAAASPNATYEAQSKVVGKGLLNMFQWDQTPKVELPARDTVKKDRVVNEEASRTPFGISNVPNRPTPDPIPTVPSTSYEQLIRGQVQSPQSTIQEGTGTFASPLQTANLSAVPESIMVRPQYTGTTMANLTMPSQGQQSIQSVMYGNDMGQTVTVTEINGQPTTYVPPGFKRLPGQALPNQQPEDSESNSTTSDIVVIKPQELAEGGSVGQDRSVDAMYRMASQFLGYKGPKTRKGLEEFAKSSPGAASKMKAYTSAMAKGGLIKGYAEGGSVDDPLTPAPLTGQIRQDQLADMSGNLMRQTLQPIQAPTSFILPQEADFIAPTAGMTVPQAPFAESSTVQNVEQANLPNIMTPATFTPTMAAPAVAQETANLQAAQGQIYADTLVQGAQQVGTAVSNLEAAQGEAVKMNNPMQREIQAGELISGSAVDATKVEALNSQMQAAEATPSSQATVQGQLEGLMTQFEGGKVPAWAAGAMRGAMTQLSARGLGASSLAGQAVVQAAMESAIPIAQVDAQTRAQFESQNLSNRQQTAMMAAQQRANFLQIEFDQEFQSRVQNSARIADIANMNFTAEQQIALENSRNANTVNLQNLGNRQAMTMAEAASLANLDMANLNNRQQAAVQNAQSFLQMDLTNLNNEQQTALFKSQQNIQSLFTDQAADNASLQFNAASENQTNQFFSNLTSQVGQFNATQRNAMDQFNVNSVNAMRQFNSEVQQQRDLFNAQNGLVIAQANAQWRQNIATLNTSAQNESNMDFAKTINGLTAGNLDQVWQRERDIMSYSFAQSESKQDRALSILLADKDLAAYREKMTLESDDAKAAIFTRLFFGL